MSSEAVFEARRGAMTGLAYRMLGSRTEAEDVVQDAWLRWRKARDSVREPAAFLNRVVTRLCLDRLKSARARREVYVGEWLPEPVLDAQAFAPEAGDLDADLSVAFLLTLERLSPLERAAFLLHDVFDRPFSEVAAALDRSEAACRQLAARARAHIRQDRPRSARPDPEAERRLTEAFLAAALTGNAEGLKAILAEDVVFHADGGGIVNANLNPIFGVEKVLRLIEGVLRKFPPPPEVTTRLARVNGMPGMVLVWPDGAVHQTVALEIEGGRVRAVYTMRNPEKLKGLSLQ
jgi:RNA polymerase sigma-70 factor (ECF subfamily)